MVESNKQWDVFKQAIDSLVDYANQPQAIVGFMGGEPMLHPQFAQFCEYAIAQIPREHLGLWSTFPWKVLPGVLVFTAITRSRVSAMLRACETDSLSWERMAICWGITWGTS